MRFWLSHRREVSLRDQLVAQMRLAVLSGDLAPGARLPSTRQLARRFHVHANTVSAAYRRLESMGWLESRRGSGVFVRKALPAGDSAPAAELDRLIAEVLRVAREQGVPLADLRARLREWLRVQPPDRFLLLEPVKELREIVVAELRAAVTFPVEGSDVVASAAAMKERLEGAVPLVLVSKAELVQKRLPDGVQCLPLRIRSVPESLAQWLPAKPDVLIAVCSAWPDFLKWARTLLVAAGFDPTGLVLCDARSKTWKRSLRPGSIVVCDTLTATRVPAGCKVIPFPLVAESSLAELRQYAQFLLRPFA
jgi:DNA-binding transcriptional regulator YhcF (GntR family)